VPAITLGIIEGPTFVHANDDADGWEHYSYVVRLTRDGNEMRTSWKQGAGIHEDPSAEDVLASMLLDASGYENARGFEDWASEYGYDTDSRKAHALYRRVGQQTSKLISFLGSDWNETSTEDAEDAARRLVSA
jgi:hypothetical protein